MSVFIDLTGQVFGVLTPFEYLGARRWRCSCSCCDGEHTVYGYNLRRYQHPTCPPEKGSSLKKSFPVEFVAYQHAKDRCRRVKAARFNCYGGRGIKFLFKSFEEFLGEVGSRPSKNHSIDRINVNGHYEPGNIRWATRQEQGRNKTNNRLITALGATLSIVEWAELTGLKPNSLYERHRHGWCDTCIVTVPRRGRRCPHN